MGWVRGGMGMILYTTLVDMSCGHVCAGMRYRITFVITQQIIQKELEKIVHVMFMLNVI